MREYDFSHPTNTTYSRQGNEKTFEQSKKAAPEVINFTRPPNTCFKVLNPEHRMTDYLSHERGREFGIMFHNLHQWLIARGTFKGHLKEKKHLNKRK